MTGSWFYLPTGQRNHTVLGEQLVGWPDQTAICGTSVLAFLPTRARWQNDPQGLVVRRPCATCLRLLEVERMHVQEPGENES